MLSGEYLGAGSWCPPSRGASTSSSISALDGDGRRRVREIVAVPGRVEQVVVETADIFTTRAGRLVRADGFPPHLDRFERAGIDLASLLRHARRHPSPTEPQRDHPHGHHEGSRRVVRECALTCLVRTGREASADQSNGASPEG